jgi:Family of unknown function (DUF6283)
VKFDRTEPCKSCPYRMNAPRKLWSREEFAKLLVMDASETGCIYECHQERKLPESEHRLCAGWAIDQKKRNTPSIMLRMGLMMKVGMGEWFAKLDVRQRGLFRTLEAMCRANGVRSAKKSDSRTVKTSRTA